MTWLVYHISALYTMGKIQLSIGAIHGYMKSWERWLIYTIHIMQSHNEYHLQMLPYVFTISLQVAGRKSQKSQENILPDFIQNGLPFVLNVYV